MFDFIEIATDDLQKIIDGMFERRARQEQTGSESLPECWITCDNPRYFTSGFQEYLLQHKGVRS